ncbi:(d)CMP kinase [Gemmata sp. JC673]|uniref:Cytidylate kinase n=1 Tax=Gemmata algarum TaxID=2975278 RepID=A0ABU5EZ64_9BACT|nr:(d)CMP kinase [Gemmata algarum]MDY3560390.1 (d)CMP kinase [Gemmata algarum]
MIVTIDGPSGVGKSTATRELAARFGFEYLNTGSMYRAVALAMHRLGVPTSDERAVGAALAGVRVEVPLGRVLLNGADVSGLIRTPEVSRGASEVAVHRAVRLLLVASQRAAAVGRDIVCDGRDQGSFVFPLAECKFFLVADARVRAERRAAELARDGATVSVEDIHRDQETRDHRDTQRDLGPMRPAPDAVVVDTTTLTTAEVVERLENIVLAVRSCKRRRSPERLPS